VQEKQAGLKRNQYKYNYLRSRMDIAAIVLSSIAILLSFVNIYIIWKAAQVMAAAQAIMEMPTIDIGILQPKEPPKYGENDG